MVEIEYNTFWQNIKSPSFYYGQFQQALQDSYHHVRQNVQARYTCDNPTTG